MADRAIAAFPPGQLQGGSRAQSPGQSLADFQDTFAAALLDADAAATGGGALASLRSQPGFAVYRNTALKGCIDALQANYPAIARLVGEEWFRAAAAIYARAHPPRLPMLAEYGESFADFLSGFEPAQEYPYLPDVARLDRWWTEAHAAPDAPRLESGALLRLAPDELAATQWAPHPTARWHWFADMPIYTIWRRNRQGGDDAGEVTNAATNGCTSDSANGEAGGMPSEDNEIDWSAEGALLTRDAGGAVVWTALGAGGCAFLDACAARAPMVAAADAAVASEADIDLAQLMATLLAAGALTTLQPGHDPLA